MMPHIVVMSLYNLIEYSDAYNRANQKNQTTKDVERFHQNI